MRFFESVNKKRMISGSILIMIIIATISFILARSEKQPLADTRFMLDTVCTITLYDWNGDGNAILDEAFGVCAQYEKMLSTSVKSSDIYRINHSNGKAVNVSSETSALLTRAIHYCDLTGGEFDITIYPVKTLWDFSGDHPALPDRDSLAEAVAKVDYTKINIDGTIVSLPKGMGIDLGAVAKGYIADRVREYLQTKNVTSAIIDLGGNVYALGKKNDGSLWRIGIRKPFSDREADVVETADCSVVTSGVYQRYFKANGKLYHHILRSSDGMPCDTGLYSVTVIAESSEQCDALSTVCMLSGYEKSLRLLSEYPDLRAVFITSDNQLLYYNP